MACCGSCEPYIDVSLILRKRCTVVALEETEEHMVRLCMCAQLTINSTFFGAKHVENVP